MTTDRERFLALFRSVGVRFEEIPLVSWAPASAIDVEAVSFRFDRDGRFIGFDHSYAYTAGGGEYTATDFVPRTETA